MPYLVDLFIPMLVDVVTYAISGRVISTIVGRRGNMPYLVALFLPILVDLVLNSHMPWYFCQSW